MRPDRRERAVAVLCAVAAACCFGSVPVFLRSFRDDLDLWWVNAVRYGTAAVFWLPFVVVLDRRVKRDGLRVPGRARPAASIWRAALIPALVNAAGQLGWAAAPYYVRANTISFVIRTSFLFTMLFGFLLIPLERALARRPIFHAGAGVSVAGVVLMFAERLTAAGADRGRVAAGLAIILWTAMCWGAYAVSVRRLLRGYPLRLAFGVISLYTAAPLIVLMLVFGDRARAAAAPAGLWPVVVVSGLIGVAFGHVFNYRAIHGLGPVITSGVQLGSPFVTIVLSAIFLAEGLTGWQLAGGLAVIAGGAALLAARTQTDAAAAARLPPAGR